MSLSVKRQRGQSRVNGCRLICISTQTLATSPRWPLGPAQSYSNLSPLGWKGKDARLAMLRSTFNDPSQLTDKKRKQTNSLGALESRLSLATQTPLLPQPSTPMGFRFISLLKAGEQVKRVRLSLRCTTFLYSNFSALSHTDQPSAWTTQKAQGCPVPLQPQPFLKIPVPPFSPRPSLSPFPIPGCRETRCYAFFSNHVPSVRLKAGFRAAHHRMPPAGENRIRFTKYRA